MKALSITLKDYQILFKSFGVVFELLILPLAFVLVVSGALSSIGAPKPEADTRIPLAVVDLDGGEAAQAILTGLERAGSLRVETYSQEKALELIKQLKIVRMAVIPANFSADRAAGRPVTLRLITHPMSGQDANEAARLALVGVSNDLALEGQIIASLLIMGDMQANLPEEAQVFNFDRVIAQARNQFERSRTQPLVTLEKKTPQQESTTQGDLPEQAQTTVPGMAVMFIFLTAQTAARSVYEEKKIGSFRRLMAAPISKASLLGGKVLLNFTFGVIQALVIFAFGAYGLRLLGMTPVPLENSPLGVLLVTFMVALCSSAMGVLIAALAHTEGQISGLSTLLMWGLGLLGGAFIPLFFLEKFGGPLIKIIPHYWANRAYTNLLIRDLGLAGVTTEMAILLGFTALFFLIGLWRFDFD